MTDYVAASIHPQTGLTLGAGDALVVKSSGFAGGTTVGPGSNLRVASGGTANNTDEKIGGIITTGPGGTINGAIFEVGATASFNGKTTAVKIQSGAQAYFYGDTTGTTVNGGYGSGSTDRGTALDAVVNGGGQAILSAGLIKRTQVNSGGEQIISGSLAIDTMVRDGGNQTLEAGSARNTVLQSGETQTVDLAGYAVGTIVSNGAFDATNSGGLSLGAEVQSDGYELVGVGRRTLGIVVSSGGVIATKGGRFGNITIVVSARTIVGVKSGGTETLIAYSNGIAVGSSVSAGGVIKAYQGGALLSMVEQGDQLTQTHYTASGTFVTVSAANPGYTNPGNTDVQVRSGGLVVFAGGTVTGNADSGAIEQVGGFATLTTAGAPETLSLAGYVVSNNQTVTDGVEEFISSGGSTVSILVGGGGFEMVLSGDVVSATEVVGGVSEVDGREPDGVCRRCRYGHDGQQRREPVRFGRCEPDHAAGGWRRGRGGGWLDEQYHRVWRSAAPVGRKRLCHFRDRRGYRDHRGRRAVVRHRPGRRDRDGG